MGEKPFGIDKKANDQITKLNQQLQDENLRMSAELDVARQLQMMVLPGAGEISAIAELDIAGYMQPADEVAETHVFTAVRLGEDVVAGLDVQHALVDV